MKNVIASICTGVLAALMMLSSGCSSIVNSHRQKEDMMFAYLNGDNTRSLAVINHKLRPPRWYNTSAVGSVDELMWHLEGGSLNYLTGQYDACIMHLNEAQRLMEDYDRRAFVSMRDSAAEGAALLTNPNSLPYRGFCRDRIMLPVFRALAYLAKGDEEGFRVDIFKLRANQRKVYDDQEKFFQAEDKALDRQKAQNAEAANSLNKSQIYADPSNSELNLSLKQTTEVAHRGYGNFFNPFAIFLSGYTYARDNDFENAIVDFTRLYKAMPSNPMVQRYYVTALMQAKRKIPAKLAGVKPMDFSIGRNSVLVIFANGCSAAFRQIALYIPIILPDYSTIATTAWPVCEYYEAPCKCITVSADGRQQSTQLIADMDGIIAQEYNRRLPGMITKIAMGAIIREAAAYALEKSADEAGGIAPLTTLFGTNIYKIAFNTADTRSWEILPKQFQLTQIPMPRDRKVLLTLPGLSPVSVDIPPTAESAILYVNLPGNSPYSFSYKVHEFH